MSWFDVLPVVYLLIGAVVTRIAYLNGQFLEFPWLLFFWPMYLIFWILRMAWETLSAYQQQIFWPVDRLHRWWNER